MFANFGDSVKFQELLTLQTEDEIICHITGTVNVYSYVISSFTKCCSLRHSRLMLMCYWNLAPTSSIQQVWTELMKEWEKCGKNTFFGIFHW